MAVGEVPEESFGEVSLNGALMEVFGQVNFPVSETQKAACEVHLTEDRIGAMLSEFWMAGCHFPESGTDNTAIHLAVSCKGISRFRQQCRLTITQRDDNGKELTKGTWRD